MSWAGFAISAIKSLNYNRGLASNKNAISSFRERAREIKAKTKSSTPYKSTFVSKEYSPTEYAEMQKQIDRKVKIDLFMKLGLAVLVFLVLLLVISVFLFNYPIDRHLFWAR